MDTLIIKKLLKSFKCFKGVYPSDKLPFNIKLPLNIIVNTDPSNRPGEHWVAISIDKYGKGEYFDSFGLPPFTKSIELFLNKRCKNGWKFNNVPLQNIYSETCGHYCVLFIIFRCQTLSTDVLISRFNSNTLDNDRRMRRIFGEFSLAASY